MHQRSKLTSKDATSAEKDFQHTQPKTCVMNTNSLSAKFGNSIQKIGHGAKSKEKAKQKR
jgi:hypothetical protein